jgi:hypothetical protein
VSDLVEVENPSACPGCGGPYPAFESSVPIYVPCVVCGAETMASGVHVESAPKPSGLILPVGFDDDDEPDERPEKQHPRYGYVVAVFLGTATREGAEELVLVEIYEKYNVWGDENSLAYHYWPYDLTRGLKMEVKTIGFIPFDTESDEPPPLVDTFVGAPIRRRGDTIGWRRIR